MIIEYIGASEQDKIAAEAIRVGDTGESSYQYAVRVGGFIGTEIEYYARLTVAQEGAAASASLAVTKANEASQSLVDANISKVASQLSKTASETAQALSETASGASIAAKITAQAAAGTATTKASEASQSKIDADSAKVTAQAAKVLAETGATTATIKAAAALVSETNAKVSELASAASAVTAAASKLNAFTTFPVNATPENGDLIIIEKAGVRQQWSLSALRTFLFSALGTFAIHVSRVLADLGIIKNQSLGNALTDLYASWGMSDKILLTICPEISRKDNVILPSQTLLSKVYNLFGSNDAVQATQLSQPSLGGTIAPNEKYALVNGNGQAKYVTHTPISFAAGDEWSMTIVMNNNGYYSSSLFAGSSLGDSGTDTFYIFIGGIPQIVFTNSSSVNINIGTSDTVKQDIGKTAIYQFVATGSLLSLYRNGVFIQGVSVTTTIRFDVLSKGWSGTDYAFYGNINYYSIKAFALTPTQALQEATLLRATFPEIPSVTIGSQVWATSNTNQVCNGLGTVIADATVTETWTTGAAGWCYHTSDLDGFTGKRFNKAGKLALITSPPEGWHVSTKAELTTLAALGGNALKKEGSVYWDTALGTNTTVLSIVGSGYRLADGSFGTMKNTASFWCADTDEVLLLNHNNNTATIVAAGANEGHSIRLVKS